MQGGGGAAGVSVDEDTIMGYAMGAAHVAHDVEDSPLIGLLKGYLFVCSAGDGRCSLTGLLRDGSTDTKPQAAVPKTSRLR